MLEVVSPAVFRVASPAVIDPLPLMVTVRKRDAETAVQTSARRAQDS